jgi:hypothetical protein
MDGGTLTGETRKNTKFEQENQTGRGNYGGKSQMGEWF